MLGCRVCGTTSREGHRFCGRCGAALGGEAARRARVTVLFADVRGASTRNDVELDVRARDEVDGLARQVLERFGGTVERSVGDAVMAVFGVPKPRDDDARRAVAAALELHREVAGAGRGARLAVGVNSGEVLVGEGGADEELVVGDAVVVAARLQQLAEPGETLVGPATAELLTDELLAGPPRRVVLRGRAGDLSVVPVEGLRQEPAG